MKNYYSDKGEHIGSPLKNLHHRLCLRLKGYDYSQAGVYFVTICVHNKACLLGNIVEGEMILSEHGEIVKECWNDLPNHYDSIELDEYIVMPNHVHGIIMIIQDDIAENSFVGAGLKPAPTIKKYTLPEMIRGFKTFSSRRTNELRKTPGIHVWQRNYYEHIVRSEKKLHLIRDYIVNNPLKWHLDRENPIRIGKDKIEDEIFGTRALLRK